MRVFVEIEEVLFLIQNFKFDLAKELVHKSRRSGLPHPYAWFSYSSLCCPNNLSYNWDEYVETFERQYKTTSSKEAAQSSGQR